MYLFCSFLIAIEKDYEEITRFINVYRREFVTLISFHYLYIHLLYFEIFLFYFFGFFYLQ